MILLKKFLEYCADESLPDSICIRLNDAHAQCNCSGIEWILVCVKNVWAPSLSKICPEEFFEKSSNSLKNSKNCLPLQIPDANLRRLGSIEADPLSIPIGTTFEAICADPNRNFGDFEGAEKIVFMCSSDGRWAPDPNLIKCGPSGTENSANSDPDSTLRFFIFAQGEG